MLYINGGRTHFTGVHTDRPTQSPAHDLGRDQVSSARTTRRGVHCAGSRPRRVVAAYQGFSPVSLISRRVGRSGRVGGHAAWSCRSVWVEPGYPTSVVVGEGVLEQPDADLDQ